MKAKSVYTGIYLNVIYISAVVYHLHIPSVACLRKIVFK